MSANELILSRFSINDDFKKIKENRGKMESWFWKGCTEDLIIESHNIKSTCEL